MSKSAGVKAGILKVSVTIGGQLYEEDLAAIAVVENNPAALNKAIMEHPGRFALWAMMEQLARTRAENIAQDLRWLEGDEIEKLVAELTKTGKKVPSVTQLKSTVHRFPRVRAVIKQLMAAKQDYRRIQVGTKTVEKKKDSAMALAANMRAEMQRPPSLKGQVADARERMEEFFGGSSHLRGGRNRG